MHHWLLYKSDVDHWTNYLFKGARWCEMYSNLVELLNAWIKEARHLPATSMVDSNKLSFMCNILMFMFISLVLCVFS